MRIVSRSRESPYGTGGDITKIINPKNKPETCVTCHQDKAAQLHLPGAHPIVDGKVTCVDCHSVHKEKATPATGHGMTAADQTCFECHQLQSGPFVFEHEAMREGCSFCHDPHGTGNDKMLRSRDANTCLQCHLADMDTEGIQIGGQAHAGRNFLSQGTCWTAGCHEGVHGSNVSPKLRF